MPQRPRRPIEQDEFDEGPSDADIEAFSDVTRACPNCKTELYDDAEICWKCGHALSGAPAAKPGWVVAIAILALIAIVIFLLR